MLVKVSGWFCCWMDDNCFGDSDEAARGYVNLGFTEHCEYTWE